MDVKILKDSSELGERNYREIMPGVFCCEDGKRLVILQPDDSGLLIQLAK
jgi:hypothetical protein